MIILYHTIVNNHSKATLQRGRPMGTITFKYEYGDDHVSVKIKVRTLVTLIVTAIAVRTYLMY